MALTTVLLASLLYLPGALGEHVEPRFIEGPRNKHCDEFNEEWAELKVEPPENGTLTDGTLTVTVSGFDGDTFDWEASAGVDAVYVKGGRQGSHLYEYDPPATEDDNLTVPEPDRNDISHISFCYEPDDEAGAPASALTKEVRAGEDESFGTETEAEPGDLVEFRLNYTNEGDGDATGVEVRDAVPEHTVFISCSNACTTDGDGSAGTTLTWSIGEVEPGASASVTFRVRILEETEPGTTILNTGEAESNEDGPVTSNEVVVRVVAEPGGPPDGEPSSALAKAVRNVDEEGSYATHANGAPGDLLSFRLTYTNEGDGDATGVEVRDAVPEHTTLVACNGPCTGGGDGSAGTSLTWDLGTVAPSDSVEVTFEVRIDDPLPDGAGPITNTGETESNEDGPVPSNEVVVDLVDVPACVVTPGDPALATASGEATGVHVNVSALDLDLVVSHAEATQDGPGTNDSQESLADVTLPADGSVATASLVEASVNTTINETSATVRSEAETVGLELFGGLLTADVVRAVATAGATDTEASWSTAGSTITGLRVNGALVDVVAPNTRVDLPAGVFGEGAYLALHETDVTTTGFDDPSGTLSAHVVVTMVHVVTTGGVVGTNEVVVSQAIASASFPARTLCEERAEGAVEAEAFTAELIEPALAPTIVGHVAIPSTGGHAHQALHEADLGEGAATTGQSVSDAKGSLGDVNTASAKAFVSDLCLVAGETGCLVEGEAVRANATASAGPLGAAASGETRLLHVVVAGANVCEGLGLEPVCAPAPNTVVDVPGGFVVLNEQVVHTDASITVNAVHVVLSGIEVIVASAHAGATL